MKEVGAWASCALVLLSCAGCSWIPLYGKPKTCDLNSYRVPAVASERAAALKRPRNEGPVLEVPETDHDFGKVSEDKLLIHDFKVRNAGKTVLKIKKVIPG